MVDNPFRSRLNQLEKPQQPQETTKSNPNPFAERSKSKQEQPESKGRSIARWIAQIPAGIAQGSGVGILSSFINTLAKGEAMNPSDVEDLEWAFQREGKEFDREKYMQGVEEASQLFPTVENISRGIENKTGLPLQPKTEGQKLLQMSVTAGSAQPGSLLEKATSGVVAPTVKKGLQEVGVPEPLADIAGFALGGVAGAKGPKGGPAIEAKTKPSGLPVRRFEKLKEPREVSTGKMDQITKTVESDFRKIADDLLKETAAGEARTTLKENPSFKAEVRDQFKKVESLAESLPGQTHTDAVKRKLVGNIMNKKGTGFAPGEYDKGYREFIKEILKDTPSQNIGAADLVKQYRKNNQALGEIYEPGKSYAANRAKKDGLLDYNRALADVIEEQYPNTEFSKLFKETNKRWSEISNAEAIDKFFDGIFDGKINFNKTKKFFENENVARPFKQALGEEKFAKFESLMKDLTSSDQAYNMLKVAKDKGWGDLVSTASAYVIHPKLGMIKTAHTAGKKVWKGAMDSLLDKPQLVINWKKGVDALKKGSFAEAKKEFDLLDKAIGHSPTPKTK